MLNESLRQRRMTEYFALFVIHLRFGYFRCHFYEINDNEADDGNDDTD